MLTRFKEDAGAMARAVRCGNAGNIDGTVPRASQTCRRLIELKQA